MWRKNKQATTRDVIDGGRACPDEGELNLLAAEEQVGPWRMSEEPGSLVFPAEVTGGGMIGGVR